MVRTAFILSLAMLTAAPAAAATLMDWAPDPAPQRAPAVPTPGGPLGHINIENYENTIKGDIIMTSFGSAPVASSDLAPALAPNVAAVPEPATWAMMLGGFGLAGFALRRRALKATASLSH